MYLGNIWCHNCGRFHRLVINDYCEEDKLPTDKKDKKAEKQKPKSAAPGKYAEDFYFFELENIKQSEA